MAESVDHIQFWDNITEDTFELLIEEFKTKENIVKFIQAISWVKKYLDEAVINVGKMRLIDNAVGVALDEIGFELGVPRNDSTDDEYRVILKIRSFRVSSSGTRDQIIDILSRFSGSDPKEINTYVGDRKSFDLAFYTMCLNAGEAVSELEKIFPVVSSYRLIAKGGRPLGFTSIYSTSPEDQVQGVLASVFDTNTTSGPGLGHLGSLIGATA